MEMWNAFYFGKKTVFFLVANKQKLHPNCWMKGCQIQPNVLNSSW